MRDELDDELSVMMNRAERGGTVLDASVREHAAQMMRTGMIDQASSRRRRVGVVVGVLVPTLTLGTAGAAFAAVAIDWDRFWTGPAQWEGWALTPDTSFTFDLPSGGSCEMRIGDVTFSPALEQPTDILVDPGSADSARTFLQNGDLTRELDIDAALHALRATSLTHEGEDEVVPFGFGTDAYNADVEYSMAVKDAVHAAVMRDVEANGLPTAGLAFSSQEQCVGEQR